MQYRRVHDWDLTPSEAVALQRRLRTQVRNEPLTKEVRLVAGADISFDLYSDIFHAGFVVLELPGCREVARASAVARAPFPYIPGLLSFREIPALLAAWEKLAVRPDVVVCDGQGIAHPRGMGIAAHLGLFIELPTIGCGKSKLIGDFEAPGEKAGSYSPLTWRDKQIGFALRARDKVSPVFVSPGHRIDLDGTIEVMRRCLGGYRVPEPTRQAHNFVNEVRRAAKLLAA